MALLVDIKKTFPDFELSVCLECGDDIWSVLGESGSGKSLTLKCIAGIEKPDSGRIIINGEPVFDSDRKINLPPQKRRVGYLFQNYALFPNMTVRNNIGHVIKKPRKEKAGIVDDLIKSFQLENVGDLYPRQISGGQQQRVALARILVSDPAILMLDEPFSALDSHLRWRMEQELTQILNKFPGTTLFVSHNRDEAYRISDNISVMNRGRIELTGSNEEIFHYPKTFAAARITGCKNISAAEKVDQFHVKAVDWGITLKTAQPVCDGVKYVGIRAHHLMEPEGPDRGNEENTFSCRIYRVVDEPFETVIMLSFDSRNDNNVICFEIPNDKWNNKKRQDDFTVYIPPEKIMCLE